VSTYIGNAFDCLDEHVTRWRRHRQTDGDLVAELRERRRLGVADLLDHVREEDWRGVQEAAGVLREIGARLDLIEEVCRRAPEPARRARGLGDLTRV